MSKPDAKGRGKTPARKPRKAAPKEPTPRDKLNAIGIEAICTKIAEGEFYADIAKEIGVSRGTLANWLSDEAHADMYARAREARADHMAEQILEIADESSSDTYLDSDGNEKVNGEVVQRSRLRVDARKWLASKMFPKRYGDVTRLEGSKENPVAVAAEVRLVTDWASLQAKVDGKGK